MKKPILTAVATALMSLVLVPSQAQSPQSPARSPANNPSNIANAVPAALCGPGYSATNISYRNGVAHSYRCSKTIPDQRPCNQNMLKMDAAPATAGNSLKLSYTCYFPEG